MEMTKQEVTAIEAIEIRPADAVKELQDIELVLVGGGHGDISLG